MRRLAAALADDDGSAAAEFVLVGSLLAVLTLAVLQFGLAVYVRNVVHDAAVEGAFHAALADTTLASGAERTEAIIARTIGDGYATDVRVRDVPAPDQPTVAVTVRATLPVIGLWGLPSALEVTAHAPISTFD